MLILNSPDSETTGSVRRFGGSAELTVELVVDRVVITADQRSRLADSLELAFREREPVDRSVVAAIRESVAYWAPYTKTGYN